MEKNEPKGLELWPWDASLAFDSPIHFFIAENNGDDEQDSDIAEQARLPLPNPDVGHFAHRNAPDHNAEAHVEAGDGQAIDKGGVANDLEELHVRDQEGSSTKTCFF